MLRRSQLEEDKEKERIVKWSGEIGWQVSWWCVRMLVGAKLTHFFPIRAENSHVVRDLYVEMSACLANIKWTTALTLKRIHDMRSKTLGNSILKQEKSMLTLYQIAFANITMILVTIFHQMTLLSSLLRLPPNVTFL